MCKIAYTQEEFKMKIYRQKDGITVASGKIKDISDDRMHIVLATQDYNKTDKKNVDMDMNIVLQIPLDDSMKKGFDVTVAGYPHGKGTFMAETILSGNDIYQTEDLTILTGFIASTRLNEEKNEDGSPKMKRDGTTPRKPHYDISIAVTEEGHKVWHQIAVYDNEKYNKDAIEKAKRLFDKFDKKSNRIKVTFVTRPGETTSYVTHGANGQEYTNYSCRHMGYQSVDIDYVDQKERTKTTPVSEKSTPAPEMPAPAPAPAPVQEQNGMDKDMDFEEEPFK